MPDQCPLPIRLRAQGAVSFHKYGDQALKDLMFQAADKMHVQEREIEDLKAYIRGQAQNSFAMLRD